MKIWRKIGVKLESPSYWKASDKKAYLHCENITAGIEESGGEALQRRRWGLVSGASLDRIAVAEGLVHAGRQGQCDVAENVDRSHGFTSGRRALPFGDRPQKVLRHVRHKIHRITGDCHWTCETTKISPCLTTDDWPNTTTEYIVKASFYRSEMPKAAGVWLKKAKESVAVVAAAPIPGKVRGPVEPIPCRQRPVHRHSHRKFGSNGWGSATIAGWSWATFFSSSLFVIGHQSPSCPREWPEMTNIITN